VDLDPAAAGDVAGEADGGNVEAADRQQPAGPSTSLVCSQSSLAAQTGAGRKLQGCRFSFLLSLPAFTSILEMLMRSMLNVSLSSNFLALSMLDRFMALDSIFSRVCMGVLRIKELGSPPGSATAPSWHPGRRCL
jgi:hypothetical protein